MAHKITTIHVQKNAGRLAVIGKGRTPRDQNYIAVVEELKVKESTDKKFKEEMTAAVIKMLG